MEDNELGALLRFGRQTTVISSQALMISICGATGMILSALGYPLFAWALYGLAGILMLNAAKTIDRQKRTAAFFLSRQPIKTIEW